MFVINFVKFQLVRGNNSKVIKGENWKYGGAQQLMLGNIPVKFEDCMPYGFWATRTAKFVINYVKFQVVRGNNSKVIRGENWKYRYAQQFMLGNIPVKLKDHWSYGWDKQAAKFVTDRHTGKRTDRQTDRQTTRAKTICLPINARMIKYIMETDNIQVHTFN